MMIAEQQEEVLENLDLNYDFELKNKFSSVNGFSGEVTEEGLEKLKNDPNVKRVYPNRPVKAFLSDSKNIVNATNAWRLIYNSSNLTGKGETVCIIDTGVDYTHSDLGNCASTSNINGRSCAKVIGGYDFVNNDENPIDDNGHGTHVAGIVASTNVTYRGIAPDANIVAIKVLDSGGNGNTADLISGIDWCCDTSDNPLLVNSIHNAINSNISVIVAAGNDDNSPLGVSSPACISNVTVVGSTTKSNSISSFSDLWGLPMLLAPGSSITSLQANGADTTGCSVVDSNMMTCSGTSMATPMVAGAFALIHQYFKLTENKVIMPNETQRYLNNTGKQITDTGGSGLTFSRINIFEAIKSLDKLSPNITITNANNSIRTNITFIVNTISNEVLSNATLEINNTNYTMSGSGLSWSANISSIKNGTYTYKAYGNDSFGNNNISNTFTINIDLIAPYWSNNITNASNVNDLKKDDSIQFNVTWDDTTDLSSFIFSWNDTGLWQNVTNGSLSGKVQIVSINKTVTATRGNAVGYKFYANDSTNNFNETDTWIFSVANAIPSVLNITINSSDEINRTNATLLGIFSYSDIDNDALSGNETKWYNNTEEVLELINYTAITSNYTKKNQNWTLSIRVYDGFNWSEWANSTKIIIRNTKPEINISIDSITINETQKVNITTNASDIDNEALTFTINDSARFSLNGIYFIWNTNLTDSGNYNLNITVNDTEGIDSKIITVTVLDARDLDNDGNPDFNDTDDDNDNINDDNDFLLGNASSINSTPDLNLNLTINGTTNLSKLFNGTFPIRITTNISNNLTNSTLNLVEFEFTFNSSNNLDIGSITTNYTFSGFSGLSLRGFTRPSSNFTKNFTIDKVNTTAKAVCIKDADASFENISGSCNGNNEFLVNCNNVTSNGYTCFDTGTRYKITGLNHSALKELCVDNDGDGYGDGCNLGSDNCDSNPSQHTSSGCNPSDSDSSGGGGGDSGGGGGGGGAFYICNMDWSCTSWSACENSWQTRECSFIKVSQHTTNESCATIDNVPQRAKKCKAIVQENETIEKAEDILNKTANGKSSGKSGIGITGAAIKDIEKGTRNLFVGVIIIALIVAVGISIYIVAFGTKEQKDKIKGLLNRKKPE
ncbi:S8 family serine peptidase [Candidatus Woesearchaeota archaeon]|nr:S8 family serine peptidase [Candidatus Woesearchaeota archaeon]